MALRRLASAITLSGGTKTNSASLSTNFLISHGQATRSTFTCSRVIHFMSSLLEENTESACCAKSQGGSDLGRADSPYRGLATRAHVGGSGGLQSHRGVATQSSHFCPGVLQACRQKPLRRRHRHMLSSLGTKPGQIKINDW